MPTTDRELPQVVVNKLTQAQYNTATKSADEFYLVTDAKVEGSDIDWTTLSENQSDIRKIHYDTFTATTDANGFAIVPTATVTPSTGMILAVSSSSQQSFTTPFNDVNQSRFTIKTESWDRTAIGSTSVSYRISYILY